jgi:hypothetical protein
MAGIVDGRGVESKNPNGSVDRRGVKPSRPRGFVDGSGSSPRGRPVSSIKAGRDGADGRFRRSKRTLTANPDGGTLLDPHHLDRREDWDVSHAQRTAIC